MREFLTPEKVPICSGEKSSNLFRGESSNLSWGEKFQFVKKLFSIIHFGTFLEMKNSLII